MIELRAQQIVIDAPKVDSIPFVAIMVQRIIYDANGNITQTINREKVINRAMSSVAFVLYDYTDPITQVSGKISGAGLGDAITRAARTWILEEYPGSTLINGKVILDAGNI